MPDLKWNLGNWGGNYDWSQRGEEWSAAWGTAEGQWFGSLLPRLRQFLPASSVLEIAPGHGRWTRFLMAMSERYHGVDISPQCVEYCRATFSGPSSRFSVNDGADLSMVESNSIDLVFSFDSLVHVEIDVLKAYIPQILQKLRLGGVAFIHHSNMKALHGLNVGDRGMTVDASVVRDLINASGGHVMRQEVIAWDSYSGLDCLTMFSKRGDFSDETALVKNDDFMAEARNIRDYIAPWKFSAK